MAQSVQPTGKVLAVRGAVVDVAFGDEMNALFEFLTTEPAICPTA